MTIQEFKQTFGMLLYRYPTYAGGFLWFTVMLLSSFSLVISRNKYMRLAKMYKKTAANSA